MNRRQLLAFVVSGFVAAPAANAATRYNFGSRFADTTRPSRYTGKRLVPYPTTEIPGTIIISSSQRTLSLVLEGSNAIEYGVGVGREGFGWSGTARIGDKKPWPDWHPPKEMIEREQQQFGRMLPEVMAGGPNNPLGARAMYLYEGERDTLYRIHGTNQPQTIGQAVSSGCIRMLNEEVVDLYDRVQIGTKVIVL